MDGTVVAGVEVVTTAGFVVDATGAAAAAAPGTNAEAFGFNEKEAAARLS